MLKKMILIAGLTLSAFAANTVVVMETNQGKIELELFDKKAPKAVENFIGLVKNGYYKGVIFHRVIPGFMIQGGDPTGTGAGGKSIWNQPFEDEFNNGENFDKEAGVLAMANSGPNTNGSQFFITTAPTPWLNNHHTIFGKVISGMDTVHSIETTRAIRDRPLKEQVILKTYIKK